MEHYQLVPRVVDCVEDQIAKVPYVRPTHTSNIRLLSASRKFDEAGQRSLKLRREGRR
jgi:hypothetical protein